MINPNLLSIGNLVIDGGDSDAVLFCLFRSCMVLGTASRTYS